MRLASRLAAFSDTDVCFQPPSLPFHNKARWQTAAECIELDKRFDLLPENSETLREKQSGARRAWQEALEGRMQNVSRKGVLRDVSNEMHPRTRVSFDLTSSVVGTVPSSKVGAEGMCRDTFDVTGSPGGHHPSQNRTASCEDFPWWVAVVAEASSGDTVGPKVSCHDLSSQEHLFSSKSRAGTACEKADSTLDVQKTTSFQRVVTSSDAEAAQEEIEGAISPKQMEVDVRIGSAGFRASGSPQFDARLRLLPNANSLLPPTNGGESCEVSTHGTMEAAASSGGDEACGIFMGARVEVCLEDGKWYAGAVSKKEGDGWVQVDFDDGTPFSVQTPHPTVRLARPVCTVTASSCDVTASSSSCDVTAAEVCAGARSRAPHGRPPASDESDNSLEAEMT